MMSVYSSLSHRRESKKSESSSKYKQSGKNTKIPPHQTHIPNLDLEQAIIHYLQDHPDPQKTIAISKAVGGSNSKFVNPTLYRMEKKRILQLMNEQPPLWALNSTAMTDIPHIRYSMPHPKRLSEFQPRSHAPQSVRYESQSFREQRRSYNQQSQRHPFPPHALQNQHIPFPPHALQNQHNPFPPHALQNQHNSFPPHSLQNQIHPFPPHALQNQNNPFESYANFERMQFSYSAGSQTGGAHRNPSYHNNTHRVGQSSRQERKEEHKPHKKMYKKNSYGARIQDTAQNSNNERFKNTIDDMHAPGAYKKTSSTQVNLTNSSARDSALVSNKPATSKEDFIRTSSKSDMGNQPSDGNDTSENAGNASFDSESEEDELQYRVSDVMKSLPRPVDFDDGSDYKSDSEYEHEDMDEDWGGSDEVTAYSALGDKAEDRWNGYCLSSNDSVVKDETASSNSPVDKNKMVIPPSPAQLLQIQTNSNAAENASKEGSSNESTCHTDNRSTSLMPWLKVNLSTMPQPTSSSTMPQPTSSSTMPQPALGATTPFPRTQPASLTLGQQLLKEGKTCVEGMEYLVLTDETEMQVPPSQQQRRPPLLSTPLVRGSNPIPSLYSQSYGYRLPFQPVSQEQPKTNNPAQQPSPNNKQNEFLPAQPKLQITAESFAALNKNPISAFMEYAQSRHLAATIDPIDQQGPSHKPVFVYAAKLGDRIFPYISSSNKKDGKKEAAEQAIRILIAEGQYHLPQQISIMKMPESSMTDHDKIAAKVHQTYNQLIATVPESFPGRKVIAGIVMEIDSVDSAQVISIGSGNRCITGDKLSQEGNTVNDCHAEIIARRGLMSFLWDQIIAYSTNQKSSILEFSPATGKLRVKSDIKIHLYISTAPCGDGALFSPRDVKSNNSPLTDGCVHRPVYTNNAHGVLRTKMEGGEGTIPIESSYKEQAWDGLITGERLRTMSCSDKICRWNVLGMQGALLGLFLDPIYLTSITLGYLYDHSHLCRAVCCRLDRDNPSINEQLPRPYRLNHPVLGRVTACDPPRETQKTKSYSVNWRLGEDRPEVLDGSLGICYSALEKNMFSRLSKRNLFDKFKKACAAHKRSDLPVGATYYTTKRANASFLQAKEAMFRKFKSTGCGKWISKPQEEEMFS